MVCGQENEVIFTLLDKFTNQVSSVNNNNDVGEAGASPYCRNSLSNKNSLLKIPFYLEIQDSIKMAFQTKKVDMKNLTPAPDRPRIFMSNKTSKVVVVFPNGEVVEGEQ